MFNKLISLALTGLLISLVASVPVSAQSQEEARQTEKVKETILKLGTGQKARVEVILKDNRKLQGHVSAVTEDQFVIVDSKTNAATTVLYAQVQKIKVNRHPHQLAIGLAFVGGLVGLALILAVALRGS